MEGWDFILTQSSFFSLGLRGRLYVILKMPSPRLLERNSKAFFFPPYSATATAASVGNRTSKSLPGNICGKVTCLPHNKREELNFTLKQKCLLEKSDPFL